MTTYTLLIHTAPTERTAEQIRKAVADLLGPLADRIEVQEEKHDR